MKPKLIKISNIALASKHKYCIKVHKLLLNKKYDLTLGAKSYLFKLPVEFEVSSSVANGYKRLLQIVSQNGNGTEYKDVVSHETFYVCSKEVYNTFKEIPPRIYITY